MAPLPALHDPLDAPAPTSDDGGLWAQTAAERASEGEYDAAEFAFQRDADALVDPARHRRSSREAMAAAAAAAEEIDPHCPGAELMRAEWCSPTLGRALEHYQEAAARALERIRVSALKAWEVIRLAEKELEEQAEEEKEKEEEEEKNGRQRDGGRVALADRMPRTREGATITSQSATQKTPLIVDHSLQSPPPPPPPRQPPPPLLPLPLPPPLGYLWSEPRARPYLRACRGAAAALRAAGFASEAATLLRRITRVNGGDEQAAREELLGTLMELGRWREEG